MFATGIALFTAASAAAALAPTIDALIVARAIQGMGGALVMPLTLTILSTAFPAERRGVALGMWGAVGGIAVASGPLVGGLVIEGISWQWIFWLNVPVGIALPRWHCCAARDIRDRSGARRPGLALVSAGLLGLVWGLVNGNADGWTSARLASSPGASCSGRIRPLGLADSHRCCRCGSSGNGRRSREHGVAADDLRHVRGDLLLTQFFQTAQGHSPLQAALRVLP